MEFLIQVQQEGETGIFAASVSGPQREQINRALNDLHGLTQQQFQTFYRPLVASGAPRCYILSESDVLLCIESELGLMLLCAGADGRLGYALFDEKQSMPKPSPFSRVFEPPTAPASSYPLIAQPCAAVRDKTQRMMQGFEPAHRGQINRYRKAVACLQDPHPRFEGYPNLAHRERHGAVPTHAIGWWDTPPRAAVFTEVGKGLRFAAGEW